MYPETNQHQARPHHVTQTFVEINRNKFQLPLGPQLGMNHTLQISTNRTVFLHTEINAPPTDNFWTWVSSKMKTMSVWSFVKVCVIGILVLGCGYSFFYYLSSFLYQQLQCPKMTVDHATYPILFKTSTVVVFEIIESEGEDWDDDEDRLELGSNDSNTALPAIFNFTKIDWELYCEITDVGAPKKCVASIHGHHYLHCSGLEGECTHSMHFCTQVNAPFDPTDIEVVINIWKNAFDHIPDMYLMSEHDVLFKLEL